MLHVQVDLAPFGDMGNKRSLSDVFIANVGNNEYIYVISEPKPLGPTQGSLLLTGTVCLNDRLKPVNVLLGVVFANSHNDVYQGESTEEEIDVVDRLQERGLVP